MSDAPIDITGALRRASPASAPAPHSYGGVWNSAAAVLENAYTMVDGSADEIVLRAAGQRVATGLRRALAIRPDHHVLEVGCGVARIGRALAEHCGEWHGADVSANMLRIAAGRTAHLSNVHLQELDGSSLSCYANATFDRVYSHIVLFHLDKEDMFGYLCEMCRVLKPDGLIYFDTWNLGHPFGWQRFLHERELHRVTPRPTFRNQFSVRQEVELFAEQAALAVIDVLDRTSLLQVIAVRPHDVGQRTMTADRWRAALGQQLSAIEPGSARLTALPRSDDAIITIDVPVAGSTLKETAILAGWALHPQQVDDPAWGEVAVFCVTILLQRAGGLPQELGLAYHNQPRPDVADVLKDPRLRDVGWHYVFDTRSVPDGSYTLWIETHLTCGYTHRAIEVHIANGGSHTAAVDL